MTQEDLSIYIKADGAPAAAAEVGNVSKSIQGVAPAANRAAAGVEGLRKSLEMVSKIGGIVAAAAAIVATFRKIAEAVDAVRASMRGWTEETKIENMEARVKSLADTYARLSAEIDKSAAASARQNTAARETVQRDLDRQLAVIDRDAARSAAMNPDRAAAIAADAAEKRRQAQAAAGARLEAIDRESVLAAIAEQEQRAAAAARKRADAESTYSQAIAAGGSLQGRLAEQTGVSVGGILGGRFSGRARWNTEKVRETQRLIQEADKLAASAVADQVQAKADEEAAVAELARLRASLADIEREGGTRRLREEAQQWTIEAQRRAADAPQTSAPANVTVKSDHRRIAERTQAALAGITVDAPVAASSYGSIGGIMGNQIMTGQRLREQREAARDAIMKEQTTLLAQIKEALDE